MKLGRFEKVDLRECWKTEDRDFTPWLARPENNFREKFERLKANCSVLLIQEFGNNVDWRNPDNITWAEIGISREADIANREDWQNQFQWLQTNAEKLADFFKPEIAKI